MLSEHVCTIKGSEYESFKAPLLCPPSLFFYFSLIFDYNGPIDNDFCNLPDDLFECLSVSPLLPESTEFLWEDNVPKILLLSKNTSSSMK